MEQESIDNIDIIVDTEIAEAKRKYGDTWAKKHFTSFSGSLPFGWRREAMAQYKLASMPCKRKECSDFLASQTYQEFFNNIDEAINQAGLSIEKIKRLQEARDEESLYRYIIPAYKILRKMGYQLFPDLTG